MKKFLQLFLIMLKIGIVTFGGGYAMIAVVESEIVTKKKWLSHDEFMDMLAISESTPGPIAINMATYLGYKMGKVLGSIIATLGVILPSFIIISLIYLVYDMFLQVKLVAAAFQGIQIAVIFLILTAGLKMFRKLEKNVFNYIVFFLSFCLIIVFSLFSINFSTIYYILIAGVLSIFVNLIIKLRKNKNVEEKK